MNYSATACHRAELVLDAYMTASGEGYSEPPEVVIQDVLADLLHLAEALGIDFDEALNQAQQHFDVEANGDKRGER